MEFYEILCEHNTISKFLGIKEIYFKLYRVLIVIINFVKCKKNFSDNCKNT